MRISDWSSDVCSSDLSSHRPPTEAGQGWSCGLILRTVAAPTRLPIERPQVLSGIDAFGCIEHPVAEDVAPLVLVQIHPGLERALRRHGAFVVQNALRGRARFDASAPLQCRGKIIDVYFNRLADGYECPSEIGCSHVCTPVTTSHPVSRLLP